MLRAKGSRLCVPMSAVGQREKARVSGLYPQKVGTRREKKGIEPGGWKVECDSSIDPEAARSKMVSQENEVGGKDGSEEMARRERGRGRLAVVSQSVKLTVDY